VRDRPTRRGRAKAEPRLKPEVVYLVDDAVDVIAKRRPLGLDGAVAGKQRLGPVAKHGERVGAEAEIGEAAERAKLGAGQRFRHCAPGIGEEPQRPGSGDRGIELAQAAGGGVARVGEGLAAGFGLPRVQRGEIGMAHVDLAAHLEDLGRAGEHFRDVGDGGGIGGDILAGLAIAARRGLHQPALLVAQRERQPVDLRLGGEGQGRIGAEVQIAADARHEFRHLRFGKGVLEAEHPDRVLDPGEALGRRRADLLRRTAGGEGGKARLDLGQPALHRVIFGVGDLWRVFGMVGAIRAPDRLGQPLPFRGRLPGGHVADRELCQIRRHAASVRALRPGPRERDRVLRGGIPAGACRWARKRPASHCGAPGRSDRLAARGSPRRDERAAVRRRWRCGVPDRRGWDRAAHSRGPRRFRYRCRRPSPRPVSCATCR